MNGSRRLQRRGVLAIGFMLIACSGQGLAQARRLPTKGCTRVLLKTPEPLSINSASYVDSLGKVAVVDRLRNNLVLIDQKGGTQLYNYKKLVGSDKEMAPVYLRPLNQGFWLSMVGDRLYRLDRDLNKLSVEDLTKAGAGAQNSIISTYDSVTAGRHFFSVGAVEATGGKVRIGFFRAPIKMPSRPEFLLDIDDVETDYYLLGHSYLTGLNGDQYAVLMSTNRSVILRFSRDGSQQSLNVMPDRYQRAPEIKNMATGPSSEAAMFKEIEGLTMPVGLFGQNGFLYLLTREPMADGKTRWYLFRIDPEGVQPTREMKLPTTANHLTVLNTNRNWYIFEEGPVQSLGQQKIGAMLIIPDSAIRALAMPSSCQTTR